MRRPRVRTAGFSLVELMIAITIGLVLLGAVISVYLGSRQTYRVTESLSRLQENARFAFSFMSRDIRMAGFLGCAGAGSGVTPLNALNNNTSVIYNFLQPIYGYDASYDLATGSTTGWNTALDTSITSPLAGRDVLVVRGAFGPSLDVLQMPGGTPPGSADMKINKNSGVLAGDILLVTDCQQAAFFQATKDANTSIPQDNVTHNTGGTLVPGNATQNLGKDFTGGQVIRVGTFIYYVRTNPNGHPALYRAQSGGTPQELVEGIEDLQLWYGVDDTGDYMADRYITAADVTAGNLWNSVVSVRVTLLMQSNEASLATTNQTLLYLDPTQTTQTFVNKKAPDLRLRQSFTTTIAIRNRVG